MHDLKFTFGAIVALESAGLDLMAEGGISQDDMRKPSVFARLYWAGRLHAEPELTYEEATKDLLKVSFGDAMRAVTAALKRDINNGEDPDSQDAGSGVAQPRPDAPAIP